MLSRSQEMPGALWVFHPDHLPPGTAGLRAAGKLTGELFPREEQWKCGIKGEGGEGSGTKGRIRFLVGSLSSGLSFFNLL